jgi:hypothetical protein
VEQETIQLQQMEQSFIAGDDISSISLSEVPEKLRSEPVPGTDWFTVTVASRRVTADLHVEHSD